LSPKRQQEIIKVVERIKKFNPNKLALEIDTQKNEVTNNQYQLYRSGLFELEANEAHQLGFRIAADLSHDQLYCIDWTRGSGSKGVGDVFEWAKDHQPRLFDSIFGWLNRSQKHKSNKYKSILRMYRECNDPLLIKR